MKKLFVTLVTLSLIATAALATNMQAFACGDCEVAAEITAAMSPDLDLSDCQSSALECGPDPGLADQNIVCGDSDPSLNHSFMEGATLDDHISGITIDHESMDEKERELVEGPCLECELIRNSKDNLFIDRPSLFSDTTSVRGNWNGPAIGYKRTCDATIYCINGHAAATRY